MPGCQEPVQGTGVTCLATRTGRHVPGAAEGGPSTEHLMPTSCSPQLCCPCVPTKGLCTASSVLWLEAESTTTHRPGGQERLPPEPHGSWTCSRVLCPSPVLEPDRGQRQIPLSLVVPTWRDRRLEQALPKSQETWGGSGVPPPHQRPTPTILYDTLPHRGLWYQPPKGRATARALPTRPNNTLPPPRLHSMQTLVLTVLGNAESVS